MPWYGWLLLAVALVLVVIGLSLAILRATLRGRRFLRLSVRGKLRCLRSLLRDRAVGWPAKALLVVVIGYLLLPIDLIPDFIPVLGQLDDIGVVVGAVALLLVIVPAERFEAALADAEALERAPRSRTIGREG
ncbi:DUF1232 domain-containing protein [bacterium]|mgnify:CR=1 FL=1|jgi:uncharacterized membrane protein YkvA (DUF1232 family)|nr:DUF1232 domain-containing protein [bacterium]